MAWMYSLEGAHGSSPGSSNCSGYQAGSPARANARTADIVGPDVIGMPVSAELVVGRDDVRPVLPDQPRQPSGRLVQVRHPVRARVAIAVGAHHPRVAIAEVLPLGDAEDPHRPLQLAGPDLAEASMVVRRVHLGDDDLAQLAAGAGDQDDPMAGLDGLGHRPTGPDRFVVGMGVDGHQRRAVGLGRVRHGLDASAPRTSEPCCAHRVAAEHVGMSDRIPRRLRLAFTRPSAPDSAPPDTESVAERGEVDFVAYGEDCILSGRTVLDGDRLTDMLNEHDEYDLIGVTVERFDGGPPIEVPELVVSRDELWLVHASGPRGNAERRHRTAQQHIAIKMGPYAGPRLLPRAPRDGPRLGDPPAQGDGAADRRPHRVHDRRGAARGARRDRHRQPRPDGMGRSDRARPRATSRSVASCPSAPSGWSRNARSPRGYHRATMAARPELPPGPLAGFRVIDCSTVLAGPYCTMLLGDLGAEVIKIEPPEGDSTRGWGPPWVGPEKAEGDRTAAYYLAINRNKRGMRLDLKTPEGAEILRRLLDRRRRPGRERTGRGVSGDSASTTRRSSPSTRGSSTWRSRAMARPARPPAGRATTS